MFTPSSIFINLLIILTASLYWFMSGHAAPAILGYLCVAIYMYDEKFYFLTDIAAILALLSIIVYFFIDYSNYQQQDGVMHFGMAVVYMIAIYFKTSQVFDNS